MTNISDGTRKTVVNGKEQRKVVSISYKVDGTPVTIYKDTEGEHVWYPEFFEINGDAIMVFSDK